MFLESAQSFCGKLASVSVGHLWREQKQVFPGDGQRIKEAKVKVWYPGAGNNGKQRWREPDPKVIKTTGS